MLILLYSILYNYIKILIRPNTNTTLRTPGPPVSKAFKAHLHYTKIGTARLKFGTGAGFYWHGTGKFLSVNRSSHFYFWLPCHFLTRAETQKIVGLGTGKCRAVPNYSSFASKYACSVRFSKWRKKRKVIKRIIEALHGQIQQL